MRNSLFLSLLFVLFGCSSATIDGVPEHISPTEVRSVELFLSRSSMNKTEFEQLKLTAGNLFAECGQIRAGRFYSESQGLEPLEVSDEQTIKVKATELLALIRENDPQLDGPGNNDSFFDPGQFYLTINGDKSQTSIKTSLDSISEPTTESEKTLHDLATTLRSIAGSSLCSNRTFYGIGTEYRPSQLTYGP